jgi:hypothetical protein
MAECDAQVADGLADAHPDLGTARELGIAVIPEEGAAEAHTGDQEAASR